eukprot:CAMPEP_0176060014 /NCGR_PEP_ID=MMETSP0120_2-20121206/29910_1 /TAXON_ID=160619 /ORGANISM="Kryptoperidinium foliaceum, Strain CCMP 1326" /LENGTH=293 /DNA_ID=CAMNT_0017393553 /DNA_START=181 /DNA_END=1060 /DNA_ORIENTATION=-
MWARAATQDVMLIWPLVLWQRPFFKTEADQVEGLAMLKRLAKVGASGYNMYLADVLTEELDIDPSFKSEFENADGDRSIWAFIRWQKRVYSRASRTPVEEVDWDGKPVPRYDGVPYTWRAWHDSSDLKEVRARIDETCFEFKKHADRQAEREQHKIFAWVEAFEPGEYQHTHVHTGAPCAGLLPLRHSVSDDNLAQELIIMDPRGENPPFNREYRIKPVVGELIVFPAWTPHRWEVNPSSKANIYLAFIAWPPEGTHDFDWEDDAMGDFVSRRTLVERPPHPQQAQGNLMSCE